MIRELARLGVALKLVLFFQVIEGPAIMVNCSSLQNSTGSKPVTTSTQCSGLSAVYYANWQVHISHNYVHANSACSDNIALVDVLFGSC